MSISAPRPYELTTDAYHRMYKAGLFEDRRVELIEGKLVEYGRKTPRYCTAVTLVGNALRGKLSKDCGCFAAAHFPLRLSEFSLIQPDVMLLAGALRDYADREPTTASVTPTR